MPGSPDHSWRLEVGRRLLETRPIVGGKLRGLAGHLQRIENKKILTFNKILHKSTCSGSEEPEPRSPEVAEPPLPGEEEEREEP